MLNDSNDGCSQTYEERMKKNYVQASSSENANDESDDSIMMLGDLNSKQEHKSD